MKKEILCCVFAAFLAYPVMASDVGGRETYNADFTHTVFVEYTTLPPGAPPANMLMPP